MADEYTDEFLAGLDARIARFRNPPWWDLIARQGNWGQRLERAFVSDPEDLFARRWVQIGMPVRFLVAIAIFVCGHSLLLADDPGWWQVLLSMLPVVFVPTWAMGPWVRATAYQRGHVDGMVRAQRLRAENPFSPWSH